MKRRILAMLLVICMLTIPMARADSSEALISGQTKVVSMKPTDTPQCFSFTPTTGGIHTLFLENSLFDGMIYNAEVLTDWDVSGVGHGKVYRLQAGSTYTVEISFIGAVESDFSTFSCDVWVAPGDYPDPSRPTYPQWNEGEMKTVTLLAGQETSFFFTPATSGNYTLGRTSSVFRCSWVPTNFYDKDAEPLLVSNWNTDNEEGETYRLAGGTTYQVTLSMWSGHTEWPDGFTDTLWIRQGEAPKNEYPTWTDGSKTLTPGQLQKFFFTPTETGNYVLYTANTVVNFRILSRDMNEGIRVEVANPVSTMFGRILHLTAGETYTVELSMWEGHPYPDGFTDSYYIVKEEPLKNLTIHSADDFNCTEVIGYVGGLTDIYAVTEPAYAIVRVGDLVSGNTAVAAFDGQNPLQFLSAGKTTISVTVNGKTYTFPVTVKEKPALEVGKTTTLTWKGSTGANCTFTPTESGTYRFSATGTGGTMHIEGTNNGTYFEESGSLTATLQAGVTYELVTAFGPDSHTITVTKGSGGGGGSQSGPSGDEPDVDPTQPPATGDTQPSDTPATEPSTEPSQPAVTTPPAVELPQVEAVDGKATVSHSYILSALEDLAGSAVRIPILSAAQQPEVALEKAALDALANANVSLELALPQVSVTLDASALATLARQAEDTVTLQLKNRAPTDLTDTQSDALKDYDVVTVVSADLFSSGTAYHSFGGGKATVSVAFQPESNGTYGVVYVAEDGTLETMQARVENGKLTFETGHFSDFAIVRITETAPQPDMLWLWIAIGVLAAAGVAVAAIVILKKRK